MRHYCYKKTRCGRATLNDVLNKYGQSTKLYDFCFDGRNSNYVTVSSYGARWVKDIKENQICLSKQQRKDAKRNNNYVTVSSYGTRWVKDIKENQICLSKQQRKDAKRNNKYVTVSSYGARWVKDIKENQICLSKQQRKDANINIIFSSYFTVGPKIFYQITGIFMESDPTLFLPNYF